MRYGERDSMKPRATTEPLLDEAESAERGPETRFASGKRPKLSRTNLDAPMSRMVGRLGEIQAVRGLLGRDRIVTILGGPGAGKTRLARECALRLVDEFVAAGGAWVVDLAHARTEEEVSAAVARALGVSLGPVAVPRSARLALPAHAKPPAPDATIQRVAAALAARGPTLIVLDHANDTGVARPLTAWMRAARDTRWLLTARSRLGVPGEALFDLGPLSLPVTGLDPELSDGVRLFLERAREARFDLKLSPEDLTAVARMARLLEGNPQAIELAAALVAELPPREILRLLEERLQAIARAPRRPPGQKLSLRAAFYVATSRLDGPERAVLARATVFEASFDAEAAGRVLFTRGDEENEEAVEGLLVRLRDRRLLQAAPTAERSGEPRFLLPQALRPFALEELEALGDAAGARERHVRYFAAKAASCGESRGRFLASAHDLLAAHRRSIEDADSREQADVALSLALGMDCALAQEGPLPTRFAMLDEALRVATRCGADAGLQVRALTARADAHRSLGRPEEALSDAELAVSLAEASLDRAALGHALAAAGVLRGPEGQAELERAVTLFTELGDSTSAGRALFAIAGMHVVEARADLAANILEQAIFVHRYAGDRRYEGRSNLALGGILHDRARLDDAAAAYARALALVREVGDRALEARTTGLLGVLSQERGELEDARRLYEDGLRVYAEIGDRGGEGELLGYMAAFLTEAGQIDDARLAYARALLLLRELGDRTTEGFVLSGLAGLEAACGSIEASRTALQRATECLRDDDADPSTPPEPRLRSAIELYRGALEIALAREAARGGELARAEAYVEAARRRLGDAEAAGSVERSVDVRLAARALRRLIEAYDRGETVTEPPRLPSSIPPEPPSGLPTDALLVCTRGRWFRAPGGATVAISRWHALQNLVVKLAEKREIAPNQALSVEELIAAGWPGERILPKAGATRVYTALSTLRRLGLRDVLVRRGGGYLFDPDVPLLRIAR